MPIRSARIGPLAGVGTTVRGERAVLRPNCVKALACCVIEELGVTLLIEHRQRIGAVFGIASSTGKVAGWPSGSGMQRMV